ncbi:flagellar hook-length control protein FliK [Marinospirillum perlucidum]|uniref:flagellar hook-length control protein FliK n=1 Tax=Marinospirillum perlucidum TaxID=1982602 RepID=UPI000DF3106C|nr:flagellar hook-length control protein FliK [Marinospirillum perlucidum]
MQGLQVTTSNRSDSGSSSSGTQLRALPTEGSVRVEAGQTRSGQVVASEPAREGQGYRVQVQLSNGEQVTLRSDRPLAQGQALQITGRQDGLVDVRLLPQVPGQAKAAQQLNQLLNQLPTLPARLASGQSLPSSGGSIQVGQVISSQALNPGQGPAGSGSYQIQLQLAGGQVLQVTSQQSLPSGQQVQIQTTGNPAGNTQQLQLRPLTNEALQLLGILNNPLPSATTIQSNSSQTASVQTLLQAAGAQLRQALPRQAPLQQPLQQLTQLVRQLPGQTPTPSVQTPATQAQTATTSSTAPPSSPAASLKEHISSLLNLIPQGSKPPSAQQLQAFIPFSGLLLEANVVRGLQTGAQGDLKLLLQQASAQLRGQAGGGQATSNQQVLQQVAQQVQAAQARIQVLQQNSLQATQTSHERGQPAQVIQMDLPYSVRGDWFQAQMEIRRWIEEKDAEAQAEEAGRRTRSWEVQLSFDLQHWGRVHTLLKLKDKNLKADIWVETAEAWAPMQKEVGVLEARLRRLGAEVERVDCHQGRPPQLVSNRHPQQIIDTEI